MSDENRYASGPSGEEFRVPADLKRGLVQPKVRTRPLDISSKNNHFWDHFGADKQPGNLPKTASNS